MLPNEVKAKHTVIEYLAEKEGFANPDPVLVWFCYILGGWKALLFLQVFPDNYFEVTYSNEKNEVYLDHYKKVSNQVIPQ